MNYIIKFLSREEEKRVFTIKPAMPILEAQKILRDLELMGMTAWVEDELQNDKRQVHTK